MKIGNIIRGFNRGVLFLLVLGIMLLYMSAGDMLISFKPSVSYEAMLDGKQIKAGGHVKGRVVYALDYFASESSYTRYKDGSRSGDRPTGNYYLIPVKDGYIALKSRQADVEALNKLSEETFEYLTGGEEPSTEFFMEGKVEKLEGNLRNHYEEYLEELGYTKADIESMGDPVVVRFVNFMAVRIGFGIGLVFVLLGIFFYRRSYLRAVRGSGLRRAEDLPDVP